MEIQIKESATDLVRTVDKAGLMAGSFKDISMRTRDDLVDIFGQNEGGYEYAPGVMEDAATGGGRYMMRAGADIFHHSGSVSSGFDDGGNGASSTGDGLFQPNMEMADFAGDIGQNGTAAQIAGREHSRKMILDRQKTTGMTESKVMRNSGEAGGRVRIRWGETERNAGPILMNDPVIAGNSRKLQKNESLIQRRKKEYAINRLRRRNKAGGMFWRSDAVDGGRKAEKTAVRAGKILKDIAESTSAMLAAVTGGGAAALLIIVVMIFCGATIAMFGDEDGNDFAVDFYGIGYGDTAIVKVAQAQLGNVGGDKFWKWYGFKNHVHWCACFVSWCGNECGYIKEGIIPKFAVVGDGARWFKNKNQWASRGYQPKGGDIIFFDFERDGVLDHVGIVESCDGKTVTTIEGNSGNACRRQSYRVGSKQIAGYGVPMYGMLIDPGDFTGIQANMVAWAKKIAADNSYRYKNWSPSNASSHKCPVCHPGSGKGWNCIGFAFAVWHHGGGLRSKCNCSVIDDGTWERLLNAGSNAKAARIAANRIGVPVIVIRNNGNVVPQSKIRAGDICGCFSGSRYYHTTFSIGKECAACELGAGHIR